MNVTPLGIEGAWLVDGRRFGDDRGWFQEWFKLSALHAATGYDFRPVQANISRSAAGVIRGIHYSTAPQGQGKLVTVMSGVVDDYVVDIRPGSPDFGKWRRVRLSSEEGNSLLLDPHLGHAFQAITDNAVVSYLVTAEFNPDAEKGITPFCPVVGITWEPHGPGAVSRKDIDAPGLLQQRDSGNLPSR